MNQLWREALHAVGPEGATPEQLRKARISSELLQQLLVGGLVRIDRLNHLDNYGALATQPPHTVSAYTLTASGAEAIGLGPLPTTSGPTDASRRLSSAGRSRSVPLP